MDVSLGALRERLLEMRAWDSSGSTFDKRVRAALNSALDRLSGDVPEALVPDEEHVVLLEETASADHNLAINYHTDNRVLRITDTAGVNLGNSSANATAKTWYADKFKSDGTWDGIMHLEVKDTAGTWHRRQSREWWVDGEIVYVTIDRSWPNTNTLMTFRIYQPEFFVRDDVMQVLEPGRIWDSNRQQVWAIDTAGAHRQGMPDFQGETKGRPFRFYRGRHFQLPPPRSSPVVKFTGQESSWQGPWQQGKFSFMYTYVWGKRDDEWQKSPMGINDPLWESAPSPLSNEVNHNSPGAAGKNIRIQMTNIDQMTNFGVSGTTRRKRSGYRLRIYVARTGIKAFGGTAGAYNNVERAGIYYLLTEIDPDDVSPDAAYTWDGSVIPDYHRPLNHSTGYFAYKPYPQHDARYELDFRVLRLPKKFKDDSDTAPIQRDAVSALLELAMYYLCLLDGVDQTGANSHLDRYDDLARRYRLRYANPGGAVEPVPLDGIATRRRYGTFSSTSD